MSQWNPLVHRPPLPPSPTERLAEIAAIIEAVDHRCMAADGPVTPTLKEMTQKEISRIYKLARGEVSMCKWGTDVVMPLEIPADCSHSGEAYTKNVGVDACLAPIIKALNDAGTKTVACCCGHGKSLGSIHLADKRVLLIYPDRASAEAAFDAPRPKVDDAAITEALDVFRIGANPRRGMRAALRNFIGQ